MRENNWQSGPAPAFEVRNLFVTDCFRDWQLLEFTESIVGEEAEDEGPNRQSKKVD